MEYNLTRDAEKLISLLYEVYLERQASGMDKVSSKKFGGSNLIQEKLLIDWSISDIDETCRELSRAGLLKCNFAGNTVYLAALSDTGVAYLEHRFTDGIKSVVKFLLSKGIPLPPSSS